VRRSNDPEARAPFRAAGADHRAASAGAHPYQKSVRALAAKHRRVKSAFHETFS
jgi:hypothetical protein